MPKSPSLAELEPRRVCLIKPSALGDIVQTLPLLAGLRERWPRAHFAWVVHRNLSGLLAGHPQLDEVIEFDRSARGFARLSSIRQLAGRLRWGSFDLTIDMQGLLRSGLMCLATGAARRVGFANAREGAAWCYTDPISVDTLEQSAVTRYWLVARALGCVGDPPAARLGITPTLRSWAAQQLAGMPRPLVAIQAGAQWETKRWPPAHFAELARRAQNEFGAGIVLVGGPGERPLADEIAFPLTGPVANLSERTKLLELAAVLEAADVVVSGDTGPAHLAAAVGTPVVAVFTCTSPIRARPYGAAHRVVATNVSCGASYLKRCPKLICMSELTPDRVWPAVSAALAEHASRRASRAG